MTRTRMRAKQLRSACGCSSSLVGGERHVAPLATKVDGPPLAVVTSAPDFASSLPGAVPVEWLSFKERGGVRPTGKIDPDVQRLAQVFGEVGLAREDWAIVVGDPTRLWGEEGRIAWVLRFLGHEKVSVVDGGWAAWTAKDLPTQRGRIELPPTKYEATARPEVRAQMEEVRGWVDDGRVWNRVLVDVRSDEE